MNDKQRSPDVDRMITEIRRRRTVMPDGQIPYDGDAISVNVVTKPKKTGSEILAQLRTQSTQAKRANLEESVTAHAIQSIQDILADVEAQLDWRVTGIRLNTKSMKDANGRNIVTRSILFDADPIEHLTWDEQK